MQTALIAGGAGFIGNHLCESLLNDNLKVICVDSLITSDIKNIERFKVNKNFSFVNADITNPLDINEEINYIFHLASPASPNKKSPRSYINLPLETLQANSQGTYQLLELAKNRNSKFLFTSTSEVYGDPLISPQNESYFGNVNPNGIRSVYDESKRFAEAITMAYFRKFNLDIRIIRVFNTYGPFMQPNDGRVVSDFIVNALRGTPLIIFGDGTQTRSFSYVTDTVDGFKKAMFSENTNGGVFNIGNPDERTIKSLAELILNITNSKSTIEYEESSTDDPKVRKPDINKAKEILGWAPKIGIEEGLGKTVEYFKNSI